jgi:hypothetical protein|tara:strand:+ start:1175 stop:1453 length:279 start_codon:yes stop_codon:yes gene_type:complete
MKVFSLSSWQYELMTNSDVMECRSCGDEIGIAYVVANIKNTWKLTDDEFGEIQKLVNTDQGQQCNSCLAMFLSSTGYDLTAPTISREEEKGS